MAIRVGCALSAQIKIMLVPAPDLAQAILDSVPTHRTISFPLALSKARTELPKGWDAGPTEAVGIAEQLIRKKMETALLQMN